MKQQQEEQTQPAVSGQQEDDWKLEGSGQDGDPNLNICESCQ